MAVAFCDHDHDYYHDHDRLPDDMWLRILSYADTDALLAVEATAPRFRDITRDVRLSANVVCAASSDEKTLERFFRARSMHQVKVLDVSNCIVAAPDFIMSWVGTFYALAELRCVNCPLPFCGLLTALMDCLPHLQSLDWSFFGKRRSDDHSVHFARHNERLIPQLRTMYVEVACEGSDNHKLLIFLLQRCIGLQKLHIHSVSADFTETAATTLSTVSDLSLVYTTELNAVQGQNLFFTELMRLLWVPPNSLTGASVSGNVVCLRASAAGSSKTHAVSLTVEPLLFKEIVVALCNEAGVERTLSEAALKMTWTHIEALTVTLLPYAESDTLACAGPKLKTPLITFLSSCRVLTELNLNSFHFSRDVDCCHILAALPVRLRALSLAPCGINREHSFIHLAAVSSKLEELDVRTNGNNASLYCTSCSETFRVAEGGAAFLQKNSALRRFSLCNVMTLRSLDFIAQLRPRELRLSFTAWYPSAVTRSIGYALSCNENLRSLVLCDRALFRGFDFYREGLDCLGGLNHLSLDVSARCEHGEVRAFFHHMIARLPVLKTLHVHYVGRDFCLRTITWLRPPAWCREASQDGPQTSAALLEDRPCVGCWMSTFIGQAKPRNRRTNCL